MSFYKYLLNQIPITLGDSNIVLVRSFNFIGDYFVRAIITIYHRNEEYWKTKVSFFAVLQDGSLKSRY